MCSSALCMEAPGHPTQTQSYSIGKPMAPPTPSRAMPPTTTQEAPDRGGPGGRLDARWPPPCQHFGSRPLCHESDFSSGVTGTTAAPLCLLPPFSVSHSFLADW
ncbi:hypothetical protein NQZ68_016861 [Dissostichus eleginoides]|nr:hypothetical protein NQZ68_016861 [Dissostichus eleginoides]